MKHASINGKPIRPQSPPQVVSRTAILILSGILIGTSITRESLSGASFVAFAAGIVGLISFVALEQVAHRGRRRLVKKTLAACNSTLTRRLERHVQSQTAPIHEPRRRGSSFDASYLPVTPAWPA
jgi:hypothetical protein